MKLLSTKLLFALAAMLLLSTSCSKEEDVYENPNLAVEIDGFELEEGTYELDYYATSQPEGEHVELFLMYFTVLDGNKIERAITDIADFEYELNGRTISPDGKDFLRIPIINEGDHLTLKVTLKDAWVGKIKKLYGHADSGVHKDHFTFDFGTLEAQ